MENSTWARCQQTVFVTFFMHLLFEYNFVSLVFSLFFSHGRLDSEVFVFCFACPCFLSVIGLKMKLKLYNLELQSFKRLSSIFKKETIVMKSHNVTILSKIAWNAPDWHIWEHFKHFIKVEKILKGSLDFIPSPSPSVKIQIMGGKIYLT